ncbi:MAG: hypothetical protein JXR95_02535 [Deltaproteobacteria bacterium]|nr:hypothetical protein [Deltaproteobacteria bacterium]
MKKFIVLLVVGTFTMAVGCKKEDEKKGGEAKAGGIDCKTMVNYMYKCIPDMAKGLPKDKAISECNTKGNDTKTPGYEKGKKLHDCVIATKGDCKAVTKCLGIPAKVDVKKVEPKKDEKKDEKKVEPKKDEKKDEKKVEPKKDEKKADAKKDEKAKK